MPQPSLFPDATRERRRARATDPETSQIAADSIAASMNLLQRRVLALFKPVFRRPMGDRATHKNIIVGYRRVYNMAVSESTVRTRVRELVELGFMEDTGETTGVRRPEIIWGLTAKGRDALTDL